MWGVVSCARLFTLADGFSPRSYRDLSLACVLRNYCSPPCRFSPFAQLLYLPSLGACVLASCTLRCRDGTESPHEDDVPGGNEKTSVKHAENSSSNRENGSLCSSEGGGQDKEISRPLCSPSCGGTSTSNSFGPPKNENGSQQDRSMIFGLPGILPSSPRPLPARAPACSSSSALLLDPGAREERQSVLPPRRVLSIRGMVLLPVRRTGVMVLLLAWTTYFGARTLRRCKDWRSERALFESAFKVCPDGIKTLNNLAVGMLNQKEAGHAEELLRRAVEVSLYHRAGRIGSSGGVQ